VVIVRKAYGAGLYAMSGPAFEPEATLALPTAKIAVMGPEAAVNAVFANKIAAIDDPVEREAFVTRAARSTRRTSTCCTWPRSWSSTPWSTGSRCIVLLNGCAPEPSPEHPLPVHDQPDPAPFLDGVMAGDPQPDGTIIWTRVAAAADAEPVGVIWSVATDPEFATIVAGGTEVATAERGHTVKVRVTDLASDRWYWYRFEALGVASRTGRLRTAPALDAQPDRLRFAFGSCQQLNDSWFVAHRAATEEPNLDFFLHLGDLRVRG
jgi:hypothetical protein